MGEIVKTYNNFDCEGYIKLVWMCSSLTVGYFLCYCSGCDVNSPRRPGPNGEGEEEVRFVIQSLNSLIGRATSRRFLGRRTADTVES